MAPGHKHMNNDLARKTIQGFVKLIVWLGLFMFLPAGTINFWQGWVFVLAFAGLSIWITAYLWKKDPNLLERRVNAGPRAEKEKSQKLIQTLTSLIFVGMMVVGGLDHRFGWSHVPTSVVVAGDVLIAVGFYIVFLVFRENTYAAATIQVAENQTVISTGPYAVVRHPMYSGALVLLAGMPLALGSWWGLILAGLMIALIVVRLLYEETFLVANLPGYDEYRRKVRYRLIPFAW